MNEELTKLNKDMKAAAAKLSPHDVRILVSRYYSIQDSRVRAHNQTSSAEKNDEPHELFDWLEGNARLVERQIASLLDVYSKSSEVGLWCRDQYGIGPVITAGLMAHINIERAPTVGHIWSFAGLNPTVTWNKGEKRPFSSRLKVLCWKAGESFVKFQGRENCYYGKVFRQRKTWEWEQNLTGQYSEKALANLSAKIYGDATKVVLFASGTLSPTVIRPLLAAEDAALLLSNVRPSDPLIGDEIPMLSPSHLHSRARRYAVKLFLSHWHDVAYRARYGEAPPLPYPIAHLGHAHYLLPPGSSAAA